MSRLAGPDSGSRLSYAITGTGSLLATGGAIASIYADADATEPADILTVDGDPIAGARVTIGSDSQLPLFQFPDGVDVLYVTVAGGPVAPIYARIPAGGGAVSSVDGQIGDVDLSGSYDPLGAAAAAQTAAEAHTDTAIAGLHLGTASTHAAGDFDLAGAAAAAQSTAEAFATAADTALNLGTAATHPASDFATPASVAAAITALGLLSASQHAASDFATPASVTAAITALGLLSASQHAASDFATPSSVAAAITALGLLSASQHAASDFDVAGAAAAAEAFAIQRGNHTGSQLAATISDFATAVLLTAPPKTRAFTTGGLLTGGGDASADRSLSTLGLGTQPDDLNFIDWSFDPMFATSTGTVPTSGLLYVQKMRMRTAKTITSIATITGATGTAPTNVGIAVFDANGNEYTGAAATPAPATWNSLGEHPWTLTTPAIVAAGAWFYVAFFVNGATSAAILRTNTSGLTTANNAGLSGTAANAPATALRSSSANSGITTMPSSLGALTAVAQTWWFGIA